jgi:hypothetical protein
VSLDLQAVFARVWEEGPYPELLDYDRMPPGDMSRDDVVWCLQRLRSSGYRK